MGSFKRLLIAGCVLSLASLGSGCTKEDEENRRSDLTKQDILQGATATPAGSQADESVIAKTVTLNAEGGSNVALEVPLPNDLNLTDSGEEVDGTEGWVPENYLPEAEEPEVDGIAESGPEQEEAPEEQQIEDEAASDDNWGESAPPKMKKRNKHIRLSCMNDSFMPFAIRGFAKAKLFEKQDDASFKRVSRIVFPIRCTKDALRLSLHNLEDGKTYKIDLKLTNRRMKIRYLGESNEFTYTNDGTISIELALKRVNRPVDVIITFPGEEEGSDENEGEDQGDENEGEDQGDENEGEDQGDENEGEDQGDENEGEDQGDENEGEDQGDGENSEDEGAEGDDDWADYPFPLFEPLKTFFKCQKIGNWYNPATSECTGFKIFPCSEFESETATLSEEIRTDLSAKIAAELDAGFSQSVCFKRGDIIGTMLTRRSNDMPLVVQYKTFIYGAQ